MWTALFAAALAGSIDEPVHTGVAAPDDYAVVVGIEDYAFLPDVPHAGRDAAAVRTWLMATRGVPPERVELLNDASREQILAAMERASGAVGRSGTLWLYFAGHGAASATTGRRLWLGVDVMADPTVFEARALSVDELEAAAGNAAQAIVWADTCYAGVGRDGQPLLQGTRFAVPSYSQSPQGAVLRWSAAGPGELSQAHPRSGHGAFTWASLTALQGGADGELDGVKDGSVSAAEAQAFVVRSLATEGIRGQTPTLDGDASFLLATQLPAAAPAPTVVASPGLPAPMMPAPRPRPAAPIDRTATSQRVVLEGRQKVAVGLAIGSALALGGAVATRSMYVSAGAESGSLEGLVVANQALGWGGIAAGVGALGLGVSTVFQ